MMDNATMQIPLSSSREEFQGSVAVVDAEDYDRLSKHNWYANLHPNGSLYVICRKQIGWNGKHIQPSMARFILDIDNPQRQVFYMDGDHLNNTRVNLRVVNQSATNANSNMQKNNTSGFKGVCWNISRRRWIAQIGVNGKNKGLGYFDSPIQAARAYDKAAMKYKGEYARTNAMMGNYEL